MKKLRKDKLRKLSSTDDTTAKHKHKHKHKCGDETCKHRKHKKRRKHKKHHHRHMNEESSFLAAKDTATEIDEQFGGVNGSEDLHEISKTIEKPEERKKIQTSKNNTAKSVNIELNKVEWPLDDDIASSITEDSSGSSYVRTFLLIYRNQIFFLIYSRLSLIRNDRESEIRSNYRK